MKLLIYRINNNYHRAITDAGLRLRILLIEDLLIVQRVKNGKLNRRATEPLDRSGIDKGLFSSYACLSKTLNRI